MNEQIAAAVIGAGTAILMAGLAGYGWLRSRLAQGDAKFERLERDYQQLSHEFRTHLQESADIRSRLAVLESGQKDIQEDLKEIKSLLRKSGQ